MNAPDSNRNDAATSSSNLGAAPSAPEAGLVSIIIACYNQAHFLGEAIESALGQTYSRREIIVVDDGSTDNTAEVARGYPDVRYVFQENAGPSAARNRGVSNSHGEYLVFLDADDRLLPDALKIGVASLRQHSGCAFVSGFCRLIVADGSLLSQPEQPSIERDHYLELLRRNYIWCPASVTYRRSAFEAVHGFTESLGRGEDYDLFLRISRDHPVFCHEQFVADYRLHSATRSADYSLMLEDMLTALEAQSDFIKGSERHVEAFRSGKAYWRERYQCLQLADRILKIAEATLPPDAAVAIATGGRNELLKLGSRRVWHFPQTITASPGRLFQQGAHGAVEVPWIEAGMRYEFRLFGGNSDLAEIAALAVIGVPKVEANTQSPPLGTHSAYLTAWPNPVPALNRFGRTTISWNTGDGSNGRIYLSQGGTFDESLPQDGTEAISCLEAIRGKGAQYLILPATSFWWLEKYRSFAEYLKVEYRAIVTDNNCCIIFDLKPTNAAAEPV